MANSPINNGGGGNFSFKVVLLGEGCVGKTSVVLRYVEDKFNDRHLTTLQVCPNSKFLNKASTSMGLTQFLLVYCYVI